MSTHGKSASLDLQTGGRVSPFRCQCTCSKMAPALNSNLAQRIASALPAGGPQLLVHHLCAQAAACDVIFSAPPGETPELTTREPHFLSVSIAHGSRIIQILAVEVLIYVTESLTTLFVSKADTTGYLYLAHEDGKPQSPTKAVVTAFLEYLIEQKSREGVRLVVSLFARAQNQYLFPGSIENPCKHVLDDRGLIRWWSRVLDSVVSKYPTDDAAAPLCARGHIVVPGCDPHEARGFLPRSPAQAADGVRKRWSPTDPLRALGKPAGVPERCLIPRFPDDPKARFVTDLDDELLDEDGAASTEASPSKAAQPGKWRSVRSLVQFWELMAYRQECAAGRLVGFLWGVFEPAELRDKPFETRGTQCESLGDKAGGAGPDEETQLLVPQSSTSLRPLPATNQTQTDVPFPDSTLPTSLASNSLSVPLSGVRLPPSLPGPSPLPAPPAKQPSPNLVAPAAPVSLSGPGTLSTPNLPPHDVTLDQSPLVLSPTAYNEAMTLLDSLDFGDVSLAAESTRTFLTAVAKEAGLEGTWTGVVVTGAPKADKPSEVKPDAEGSGSRRVVEEPSVAVLGAGLVRKKKRAASGSSDAVPTSPLRNGQKIAPERGPNVLAAGLVRKKPKV